MCKRESAAVRCNYLRSIFEKVEIDCPQKVAVFLGGCREFGFVENVKQRLQFNVQGFTINRGKLRELLIRQAVDFVNAVPTRQFHLVEHRRGEVDILFW